MASPRTRTVRRLALGVGLGIAGGWAYGLLQGRPAPMVPLAAGSAGAGDRTPAETSTGSEPVSIVDEVTEDPAATTLPPTEPDLGTVSVVDGNFAEDQPTAPEPAVAADPVSIVDGNYDEQPDAGVPEGQIVDETDDTVTVAATESTAADPLLAARARARRRLAGE